MPIATDRHQPHNMISAPLTGVASNSVSRTVEGGTWIQSNGLTKSTNDFLRQFSKTAQPAR
jgi:hypothetical protein